MKPIIWGYNHKFGPLTVKTGVSKVVGKSEKRESDKIEGILRGSLQ
jgi:hypothetical protein